MKKYFTFLISSLLFVSSVVSQNFNWNSIDVQHFDINLSILDLSSKTIKGNTDIIIVSNTSNLDSIYLYFEKLDVDSIIFNDGEVAGFIHSDDSILKIKLPIAQQLLDTFTLNVFYHGQPGQDPGGFGGFYFSSDNNYAYNIGVGLNAIPHCLGRVWFPCVDNFTDKATVDLKITTKSPKIAICGGTLQSKTDDPTEGTTLSHWKMSEPVPSYLVSVAVSDYVLKTDTFNGTLGRIPIDIYVRTTEQSQVNGTFANLKAMLSAYEEKFGPYRWERVGYVGVPFLYGAMEHAMNIAFPRLLINGNLLYESIVAHELSHHWFGDLVTCATAEDMWINEGWAVFSEYIYKEAIYGNNSAIDYIRGKVKNILQSAHIDDNGYKPLYPMPQNYTYGTTTYEKGAIVVHMLRHYIGNDLFFQTVRNYLNDYMYKNISTEGLQTYFSTKTGIDLEPFFNSWVYRPGFSAFLVDSFKTTQNGENYNVQVFFNQKLKGTQIYATQNKFEVLFIGKNNEERLDTAFFAGTTGNQSFTLPFEPKSILIDPSYKTAFATTKRDSKVTSTTALTLDDVFCKYEFAQTGTGNFRLLTRHHWVAPDAVFESESNIFRISDYRFWEIDGNIPQDALFSCRFTFNKTVSATGNLDNTFLPYSNSADSLVLLYRENAGKPWRITTFIKTGSANSGYLTTSKVMPGQYALGIGLPNQSGIDQQDDHKNLFTVFPNPSEHEFNISINENTHTNLIIRISDMQGKILAELKPDSNRQAIVWKPNDTTSSGTYFIQLYSGNTLLDNKTVIYK